MCPTCDERPPYTTRHQTKQLESQQGGIIELCPLDIDNSHVDDGVQHHVDDGKHFGDGGEVVPGIADCKLPSYQHRDPLDDVDHEPDIQHSTGFFISSYENLTNLGNQQVVKRMMITRSILMICFLLWLILLALLSWLKDLGHLRLSLRFSNSCSEMEMIE